MPRTKQRKARRNSNGCEQIIRDFNRLVQLRINSLQYEFKGLEQRLDGSINLALNRYPLEIQNLTLQELLTLDVSPTKENLPPKTPKLTKELKKSLIKPLKSTKSKRTTTISDDGYQSESTASHGSKIELGSKRRSKSLSRVNNKRSLQSLSQNRKSALNNSEKKKMKLDVMKTPNCKTKNSFVITPKVKLNSAVNVLRKPKDGEMVFSTQGSPLLVSTTVNDRTANINVPLTNGNVVSLLPFHEMSLTENLYLDEETRHQLMILQSHLSKVLK